MGKMFYEERLSKCFVTILWFYWVYQFETKMRHGECASFLLILIGVKFINIRLPEAVVI